MKNKILMIMLCLSIVIGSMGEITYAACSVDAVKGNGRNVNVNSFSIDETVIDEDASSREEKSDSAQNSSDEDEDLQGDYQESDMEDDDSEENKSSYGGTVQNSDIESDEDVSESTENDDSTSEIAREDLQEEPQGDLEFGNEDKNLNDSGQSGNSDFDSADASRSATEAQAAPDESEEGTGTHSVDDNLDAEIEFTEEAELYNDASGSFTYIVSGKNITITGYSGAGGVLAIPAKLDNYTVTAIGNEAFKNYTAITEIDIPGSVLSINYSAFSGCTALKKVTTHTPPNDAYGEKQYLEIQQSAFSGCTSLAEVTLADGLKSLGTYAFDGCTSLTQLNLPEGIESIGQYVIEDTHISLVQLFI